MNRILMQLRHEQEHTNVYSTIKSCNTDDVFVFVFLLLWHFTPFWVKISQILSENYWKFSISHENRTMVDFK